MKNSRATTPGQPVTFGLLAHGSCGSWRIDVDEATSEPDRWFLQIEGPSAYFSFEIPSLDVIEQLAHFLASRPSPNSRPTGEGLRSEWELTLGTDAHTPVSLLRDDESDDRFFLHVSHADALCVRYTLRGDDVKCVAAALEQVREDLAD